MDVFSKISVVLLFALNQGEQNSSLFVSCAKFTPVQNTLSQSSCKILWSSNTLSQSSCKILWSSIIGAHYYDLLHAYRHTRKEEIGATILTILMDVNDRMKVEGINTKLGELQGFPLLLYYSQPIKLQKFFHQQYFRK